VEEAKEEEKVEVGCCSHRVSASGRRSLQGH
jgi:hypothetical protein